jgi:hypothetical protein
VIECPADTDQANTQTEVQFLNGTLATTDPALELINYTCFLDAGPPQPGLHYYDLVTFTVTQEDVYTFDMITDFADFDGALALFQGDFNPNSPCENIIAQADVGFIGGAGNLPFVGFNLANFPPPNTPPSSGNAFDPIYRIQLPLLPGQTYTLMATSWGTEDTGNWTMGVYSDGNGLIDDSPAPGITPAAQTEMVVRDLICDDIDEVLFATPESWVVFADGSLDVVSTRNDFFGGSQAALDAFLLKLGYTGIPTATDNCGSMVITVSDVVTENGDCGDVIITRTFDVRDKYNSDCTGAPNTDVCQQIITVRKPTSVMWCRTTIYCDSVECDEGFDTDANGNPHPSVTGYPWLRTAFAFQDLDQTYCNLGASYSDEPRVVTCESGYKVRREWNVFNWCDPSELIVIQSDHQSG